MAPQSDQPEVSIIVPVYNMSQYLRQCLDSIANQTFKDWECILVDDGSKDDSGAICDEYAARDNRFHVLHVKNGGLSYARNNGIRAAAGKYITFCDSDDWLDPEAIGKLHELITSHNADIAQVNFWKEYNGFRELRKLCKKTTVLDRKEANWELIRNKMIRSYVWNKIFRREIIGPDFPEGQNFEDIHVCSIWFPKIQKMVCDPTPLYHYRMRKGSIIHSNDAKNRLDYLSSLEFRLNKLTSVDPEKLSSEKRDVLLTKAIITAAKNIARQENDKEKRLHILAELSKKIKSYAHLNANQLGRKVKFRRDLLISNPAAFSRLMRIVFKTDLYTNFVNTRLYP